MIPEWIMQGAQVINLLLLPAMAYIVSMERRIYKLETLLALRIETLPCIAAGGVVRPIMPAKGCPQ